jgi:threonine/homoserine/homoserine lactone efflux protein
VSFQDDMALAWGGIVVGFGVIALWGAVTSEGLALRVLLVLFGVTFVAFGARTMYHRTWPTARDDG